MAEFKVKGLKELGRLIERLPKQFQHKVRSDILRKGLKPAIKMAKSLAPVAQQEVQARGVNIPPGTLMRSIGFLPAKKKGLSETTVIMGARRTGKQDNKDGWFAHFVEFGTGGFEIAPKGKFLVFKIGSKLVFAKKVRIPKVKKRPFIQPAFEKNIKKMLKTMVSEYQIIIDKEVTKQLKKV